MSTKKTTTETYVLSELTALDPVTVYVTNYAPGAGKVVIECYSESWAVYWGGMGSGTLQQFFVTCDNAYILNKLLKNTEQTDFDEINDIASKKGIQLSVTSDIEVAMSLDEMDACFGPDWQMDLPTCSTPEYEYLGRIVDAIKAAFNEEHRPLPGDPES